MTSLLQRRRAHVTALVRRGPSLQPHAPLGVHLGERVRYVSGAHELIGLYAGPGSSSSAWPRPARAPALLYLHGGWALADADLLECLPFLAAGFAVFAPAYRGENGNPGDHEMLYGELDDALAALAWLRARDDVDPDRVFVFGHSAGGMLAALLALEPELGARMTGSANGIYDASIFDVQTLPFVDTPLERELRLLLPHVEQLVQPHLACVGDHDPGRHATERAEHRAAAAKLPLERVVVPGDHYGSLGACLDVFLRRVIG